MNLGKPICAGNVITYEGAKFLMESGADVVKVGMSSGSICTTQREKATGRAPMTALMEVEKARTDYFKETGKYVSIIIDGGFIKNTLFLKYLSALRYKQNIFLNKDSHGTAVGAFLLCNKQSRYKLNLTKVEKSKIEVINEYKKQWLNLI